MLKPLSKDKEKQLDEMYEDLDNLLSNFEAKNIKLGKQNAADILSDYLYEIKSIKISDSYFEVTLSSTGKTDTVERYTVVKDTSGKISAIVEPNGTKIQIINV